MTNETDVRNAFYDYYIDRHGVEPDDKGSDRESRIDFNAGYQAALTRTPSTNNEVVRALERTNALIESWLGQTIYWIKPECRHVFRANLMGTLEDNKQALSNAGASNNFTEEDASNRKAEEGGRPADQNQTSPTISNDTMLEDIRTQLREMTQSAYYTEVDGGHFIYYTPEEYREMAHRALKLTERKGGLWRH